MRTRRFLAPALVGALACASISPALAQDAEAEIDGLEIEVDRGTVMVGDEIELEVSFERELDDDGENKTRGPRGKGRDRDGSDEDEDDGADEGDDTTDGGAVVPTSVSFTVDFGDGSPAQTLDAAEQKGDAEEFEAEAGTTHVYAAEGSYAVSVTATPDLGEPVTATVTVTVTTDPVAYGRKPTLVCPDGLEVPSSFKDVRPGSPHTAMVDCLATRGLVRGRSSAQFNPAADVSRGQMASFLVRLLDDADVALPEDPDDAFDDDDGTTHEDAINRLAAAGLITGADGEVRPNRALTREQMATLLVRALEAAGLSLETGLDYFTDDAGSVHEGSINRAAAAGIATGRSVLAYEPHERLNRAQLATFLARALDLLLTEQAETA
ncbi:MAG: S-layer homology domain-containing protein [Nitriliruptoraceae bacterium]